MTNASFPEEAEKHDKTIVNHKSTPKIETLVLSEECDSVFV